MPCFGSAAQMAMGDLLLLAILIFLTLTACLCLGLCLAFRLGRCTRLIIFIVILIIILITIVIILIVIFVIFICISFACVPSDSIRYDIISDAPSKLVISLHHHTNGIRSIGTIFVTILIHLLFYALSHCLHAIRNCSTLCQVDI